jgi:hypothetical protein
MVRNLGPLPVCRLFRQHGEIGGALRVSGISLKEHIAGLAALLTREESA